MPRPRTALALLLLMASPGCCTIARLFCGPDDSAWVQVDYETPAAAVRTFLEALRRENVDRAVLSLDDDYKQAHGIEAMTAALAWQELRRQNPYLYMAGYAQVPDEPTTQAGERASYDLDVEGYRLHLELRRRAYWQVHYLWPNGSLHAAGKPVPSLAPYLRLPGADDARFPTADNDVPIFLQDPADWRNGPAYKLHSEFAEADLEHITRIEFGREWKISELRMAEPD